MGYAGKATLLAIVLTVASAQAQDFTQEVLEKYKRETGRSPSTIQTIDAHKLLTDFLSKATHGMASEPPITCNFRLWMSESGSVDMIQKHRCNDSIMAAVYSGLQSYHYDLNRYKPSQFKQPREEEYVIVVGDPKKVTISRRYKEGN
ncbi:hypothetical protein KQ940_13305 [Marinobacterium sp. D7]|uniref:hypothetical protein n=1 Tax=Marinobacterium ramblicola TaxID=2849041 RepID=UPI001C2D5120|nr:hypothetical protein [Marinobacterium ramblicola]MBV1789029.1 hypothetical protein [Marinobacterium ramblicola]